MASEGDIDISEESYIPVVQAVKLIPRTFDGNPKHLREFIEGVEAAVQVVHPTKQPLLLRFIESKISGDAKDRLLARTERETWIQVKAILEENFSVRRTLEYYAGILFNSKQSTNETVAQWGSRLDGIAMDLRREVRNRLERLERRDNSRYVEGGLQLIGEFLKGTFVAGLKDDKIKYIVKAKGEEESLAQLIETALQEESEVKSTRFRGNQNGQGHPITGAVKREFRRPYGSEIKREVNLATKEIRCYNCNEIGHISRECGKRPQPRRHGGRDRAALGGRQGNENSGYLSSRR